MSSDDFDYMNLGGDIIALSFHIVFWTLLLILVEEGVLS
jgi:hypothetical protein